MAPSRWRQVVAGPTYRFTVTTAIPAPPPAVMHRALDMDVHESSFPGSRETATTGPGGRVLGLGDTVSFEARHFGVTWRMSSRISRLEYDSFRDEQVRGPFALLVHDHHFAPQADGTLMTDRIEVRFPGGFLGTVPTLTVLGPYLRRLIEKRAAHLRSEFM